MSIKDTLTSSAAQTLSSGQKRDKVATVKAVSSSKDSPSFNDKLAQYSQRNQPKSAVTLLSGNALTTLQDVSAGQATTSTTPSSSEIQNEKQQATTDQEKHAAQAKIMAKQEAREAALRAEVDAALAPKELDPYTKRLLERIDPNNESQAQTETQSVHALDLATAEEILLPKSLSSSVTELAAARYAAALSASSARSSSTISLAA